MDRWIPRWFVRWLDADIAYLVSGGTWTGASQLLAVAISFATAYVFAHYLPQDAYGIYKYMLAAAALLAIPVLDGMNTGILQGVAQGADGTARAAMRRRFLFGLTSTVIGLAFALYYYLEGNRLLSIAFAFLAVATPFMETFTSGQAILLGKKRFDIAARQSMLTSFVGALAVIVAVLATHDALWVIIAYFASLLVVRGITFTIGISRLSGDVVSTENLRFGTHVSIAGVLGLIAGQADILILWHTGTSQSLALYAFALAAVTPFQGLVKSFLNLSQPKFAVQSYEQLRLTVPRRARQAFLTLLLPVAAAIIALPFLFQLFFPAYQAAVPFAQIMTFSVAFYSEKLYSIALLALRRTKALYTLNLVNATIHIALLFLLIPLYGAWGAAAVVLIQQVLASLLTRAFFFWDRSA